MNHETIGCGGDRRPARALRRWLAALVTPSMLVLLLAQAAGPGVAALVPLPTTTVAGRPTTTTTTVAGRPTTTQPPTTPPRETTTTTVSPSTTTTVPTAAPPTAAPSSSIATSTTNPQPIPEPPTSPPTSEPETAALVMSNPVVVDPEDPTVHPPLIVNSVATCIGGTGAVTFVVMNVDSFHYPYGFTADYAWSLTDGSSIVEQGSFEIAAWDHWSIHAEGLGAGSYSVEVTDTDLGVTANASVDVGDCSSPPNADPLPPIVLVPAVTCAEEPMATGGFDFYVHNQPGDDGTARDYDLTVTWTDQNTQVDTSTTGPLDESWAAEREVYFLQAGDYTIIATDSLEPALTASISVEVPPCPADSPLNDSVAPLFAAAFVDVAADCADPALGESPILIVFSNNYLHLGGTGDVVYEWTLTEGAAVIETYSTIVGPGVNMWATQQPLAPGEYTGTIVATSFPAMTDTVTFSIHDCNGPQPDFGLGPTVHHVMTVCAPQDDSETVMFFVEHYAPTTKFVWSISDGQTEVDGSDWTHWAAGEANLMVIRHLPVGALQLTITNDDDPSITMTTTLEIESCGPPVDPAQPGDPGDPNVPSDPGDPAEPPDTTDPPQAMEPSHPAETATLPATR